jgi:transcriptional antiterminator NusG
MADDKKQLKWYCLRVISNKERKIKERIDLELSRNGWDKTGLVTRIILPVKVQRKLRNRTLVHHEQILMPGYLIVEADVNAWKKDDILPTITGVKDVIDFLGKENPTPMREDEVQHILRMMDESDDDSPEMADPFMVGTEVKVTEGFFENFIGIIQEVNEEKKKLKVITKVFGRDTEVELNFTQVEKQ